MSEVPLYMVSTTFARKLAQSKARIWLIFCKFARQRGVNSCAGCATLALLPSDAPRKPPPYNGSGF